MAQYASQTGQEQRAEHVEGSITSPIPVGMIALAFATAIIGCAYAGFIIPSDRPSTSLAVGAALFFGGIVQILAGMWEFRHDDTNPATIFTSYGGFLVAFGAVFIPGFGVFSALANTSTLHQALGLFFMCWTIISGVLFLGSLRTNIAMMLTHLGLFLAYLLLTIGELASANTVLLAIGGWIAIVTGLVGWYTALASLVDSTNSPYKLPMGWIG